MTTTRRIGVGERRARLLRRHRLADRADSVFDAADSMIALHATDPATVYLSSAARLREPRESSTADVDRALYEERTLLRMLGMRRTVFVVPLDVAAVVQAACTDDVAVTQRKRLVADLARCGVADDPDGWLADVEASVVRAIDRRGEAFASELSADEPRLRTTISIAEGKSYGRDTNITSRVLLLVAARGLMVRGRPRGSWTSTQYRWASAAAWLPDGLASWDTDAARVELARRWLRTFGPAPVADLRWWTGWTAGQTTKALAALASVEVDLDGATGLVLPDDVEPEPPVEPAAVLLPALDPTPMGWVERGWFLGEHGGALFDRTGNIGPTVWWDGRIVGGWAHRDGEVVFRLLEDVGAEAAEAVTTEAERLTKHLDGLAVTPRFRTPLERELTG